MLKSCRQTALLDVLVVTFFIGLPASRFQMHLIIHFRGESFLLNFTSTVIIPSGLLPVNRAQIFCSCLLTNLELTCFVLFIDEILSSRRTMLGF